jgi:hypothetical protein
MLFGFSPNDTQPGQELRGQNDSVEKQILFNGRAWRNLYYNVQGDQFLFENKFFPGTVTIGNRQFTGIILKYDIFNDEIITVNNMGIIIQLNKEMIDRFTLSSGDITYYFYQIDTAQYAPFSGYVNVLFEDDVSLLIRYRKEILQHTGDAVFYRFNQLHRIYLSKEGILYPVGNKKDLLDFMTDRLHLVRSYIKNNRIRISKKDPRSFVPVVEYYNNLLHQK